MIADSYTGLGLGFSLTCKMICLKCSTRYEVSGYANALDPITGLCYSCRVEPLRVRNAGERLARGLRQGLQ